MSLNNGRKHRPGDVRCDLTDCTFFFPGRDRKNLLMGHWGASTAVAFAITEAPQKIDVIVSIPPAVTCEHYDKGCLTSSINGGTDTHLTYHGRAKGKKQSGETHLVVDGRKVLKDRANLLEAPLAESDDLCVFPLPLCRLELCDAPGATGTKERIQNWFELTSRDVFFNTLDVYLARKGFTAALLNAEGSIPNVVISIFAYTTLEVFRSGRLIRRRGRYPQVLVLQTRTYELVVIAMQEAQNLTYDGSRLCYFHSRNYIQRLLNRRVLDHTGGYFVDLLEAKNPSDTALPTILDLL